MKTWERKIADTEEETKNYSLSLLPYLSKAKKALICWGWVKNDNTVMLLGKLRAGKTKKATNLWGRGGSEIELEEEQDT